MWNLRSQLEDRLAQSWQANRLVPTVADKLHPPVCKETRLPELALRRVAVAEGVVYSSAIALRLAAQLHQPAVDLAEALARSGQRTAEADLFLQGCTIGATGGLVQIHVGDRTLAAWLDQFAQPEAEIGSVLAVSNSAERPGVVSEGLAGDILFELQAAHARCCSLLALGTRTDLIDWDGCSFRCPVPLPWLQHDQKLRLGTVAERELLLTLLDAADDLEQPRSVSQTIRLTIALSQTFHRFDAECRIFGAIAAQEPMQAQVRLGLVQATRCVLGWQLERQLQTPAWQAL